MIRVVGAVVLIGIAPATSSTAQVPAVAAGPAMPDWLAGCWTEEKGERWTEEC